MTIADLALKQEARPMLWPARSFLPTQTTFLRRIAMLRNSRVSFDRRSPIARGLAVGAVVACGLLIAGLRSPGSREEAPLQAAEKPAAERQSDRGAAELTGIDLTHAPDNAIFIAAFRPAAIFRMPGMGEYGKLLGEASGLPTPLTELEQVTVALLSVPKDRAAPDDVLTIYQMTRANDFARELASMRGAEKIEYHGRVYLKNPPEGPPETRPRFQRTLLRLNDRTLVTALTDEAMRKFIDAKLGLPPFLDAKQW
jgi:hypothetical protein